jgi:hypothetical protein
MSAASRSAASRSAASRTSSGSGREAPGGTPKDADAGRQTPNTDMQDEDAGTAESGNDGRAVQGAMKQTSKVEREAGSKR